MKKIVSIIASALSLALILSACGGKTESPESTGSTESTTSISQVESTDGTEKPESPEKTAKLYCDFSCGSAEGETKEYDYKYAGELTPAALAEGLSELTGLDFTVTVTEDDSGIHVDWADSSTLVAGLDEREQKEEFHFFDSDTLNWFMMDSLYKTLSENFGKDVYYSQNGGDLEFEYLYPVKVFPANEQYMGSAFYLEHSGNGDAEAVG